MATVTVQITNPPDFNAPLAAWQQAANEALTVVTELIAGVAQANSPVDRGFFRAGITPNVIQNGPLQFTGQIGTVGVQYASVIEEVDPSTGQPVPFGRSPGAKFPPLDLIQDWVERHGIADNLTGTAKWVVVLNKAKPAARLKAMTFLVARAIATRGLPNAGDDQFRPIGRAIEDNADAINQILTDDLSARLMELIRA
jgi:hypothetical protein